MKHLIAGALIIAGLALGTGAAAATVGKSIISTNALWGFVDGPVQTKIYKIVDTDNKTTCYVAYHGVNFVPDMECVK